jgi:RNA polymerase sigma-70 factor (ECF subfamily)
MNWNEIVDRHGPLVWGVAYRLLGNEPDAADCYQDAFAAALIVARSQRVENWPAMLRRLATNHALDKLRKRVRRGSHATIDDVTLASPETGPDANAEAAELIDWIRGALPELPPQHAAAFSLTCIDELSYDEAAEVLGVSPNNVGVLLHRARAKLREMLAAKGLTRTGTR